MKIGNVFQRDRNMEAPEIPAIDYQEDIFVKHKNHILSRYSLNPGTMDAFNYPVTRKQAFESFHLFLEQRLPILEHMKMQL